MILPYPVYVNHILLLISSISEDQSESSRESNGERRFLSFTRSSLMSAAAPSAGSGCGGQESVTVHVLLRRMH